MKRPFALLTLNGNASGGCLQKPSGSQRLRDICRANNIPVYTKRLLEEGALAEQNINPATVFLIAGRPSKPLLMKAVRTLFQSDFDAMVVVDALDNRHLLDETIEKLIQLPTQLVSLASVPGMLKAPRLMAYQWPMAEVTSTIFAFLDWDTSDPLVLTIERGHDPFAGFESAPGGFLNVLLETVAHCAIRELFEETSIIADEAQLHLIDVRSAPERDPRHHVIDIGFAWYVPRELRDVVQKSARASDDAKPGTARFVRVVDVLERKIAFDHADLLKAAVRKMAELRASLLRSA